LHHLWSTFTYNKNRIPFDAWEPYVDAMKRPGLIRSSASFYRSVYGAVDPVRKLIGAGKVTNTVLSISGQASFGEARKAFVEAFAKNIVKHVVVTNSATSLLKSSLKRFWLSFACFSNPEAPARA